MNDEWSEWKSAWDAGARSLPEIQALADKQRRRMLVGVVGIWAIGAPLVVGSVVAAVASPSWVNTINAVFQALVISSMVTFVHVLMWGNWREPNETPDALLALMQRRWTVRRRLAGFVRWGGLSCCACVEVLALVVASTIRAEATGFVLGETVFTLALGGFFWFVSARQYRKADAALAELAEQRRLLRDSDPGAEAS